MLKEDMDERANIHVKFLSWRWGLKCGTMMMNGESPREQWSSASGSSSMRTRRTKQKAKQYTIYQRESGRYRQKE